MLGTISSSREVAASSLPSIVRANLLGNFGAIARTGGCMVQGPQCLGAPRELGNRGFLQGSRVGDGHTV